MRRRIIFVCDISVAGPPHLKLSKRRSRYRFQTVADRRMLTAGWACVQTMVHVRNVTVLKLLQRTP